MTKSGHLQTHLLKARRLLEPYWFVVRLRAPFPFHFMVLREGEARFIRVECACHGSNLTCDPMLLLTVPAPARIVREVWFFPTGKNAWEIRRVLVETQGEWRRLYSKN